MRVQAHAKINWTLAVHGRRSDGYHDLDTVMQHIDLADEIVIQPIADPVVRVALSGLGAQTIAADASNTAHRAASCYREAAGIAHGFSIAIAKHIPSQAGLGGGSADAAAVLHALETQYYAVGKTKLFHIAASIGADVPFCLHGGAARCRGIGEHLAPIAARSFSLAIVQPTGGISTQRAFEAFDQTAERRSFDANFRTEQLIDALQTGSPFALADSLFNDLTDVSASLEPAIRQALDALKEAGALVSAMSGSGSACYGLFTSDAAARTALNHLKDFPFACATRTRAYDAIKKAID